MFPVRSRLLVRDGLGMSMAVPQSGSQGSAWLMAPGGSVQPYRTGYVLPVNQMNATQGAFVGYANSGGNIRSPEAILGNQQVNNTFWKPQTPPPKREIIPQPIWMVKGRMPQQPVTPPTPPPQTSTYDATVLAAAQAAAARAEAAAKAAEAARAAQVAVQPATTTPPPVVQAAEAAPTPAPVAETPAKSSGTAAAVGIGASALMALMLFR